MVRQDVFCPLRVRAPQAERDSHPTGLERLMHKSVKSRNIRIRDDENSGSASRDVEPFFANNKLEKQL